MSQKGNACLRASRPPLGEAEGRSRGPARQGLALNIAKATSQRAVVWLPISQRAMVRLPIAAAIAKAINIGFYLI